MTCTIALTRFVDIQTKSAKILNHRSKMPRQKQVQPKHMKRKTVTQKRNTKARKPVVVSEATKNLCRNWLKTIVGKAELPEIESGETDSDRDDFVPEDIEQISLRTLAKVPRKQLTHSYLFECEWDGCKFECDTEAPYFKHVAGHSKFEAFEGTMSCMWDLCKFETPDMGDMERHINYHAYHTKLKTYGLGIRDFVKLPACRMDSRKRNDIPEQPTSYPCSWDECPLSFQESIQDFLDHVFSHAASSFAFLDKKIKDVKCLWLGCDVEIKRAKLRAHIDAAHVREKVIGCHNCGTLFVRRKGLVLHCQRQADDESCQYQCPECMKLCATPQLFREHAKQHIVNYKCDICQMCFVSRSALSLHIRTRHIATEPFRCPHCDKGFKVKRQFEVHLRTHTDLRFECTEFECNYSSKTKEMLTRHRERKHEHYVRIYKCHMCNCGYRISKSLTKHLRTVHELEYPCGHKRFTYRQYEDGFYRLIEGKLDNYALKEDETVPNMPNENTPEQREMSVKFSYRLKHTEEMPLEPAKKMVTITVHDEDAEGNVIREKTLQVDEIFEAPEQ